MFLPKSNPPVWHTVERFREALSSEMPLREVELTAEEEKTLAGFGFLTRKPMLVLLNLHEGQGMPSLAYAHAHSNLAALQGKLEMEIAQLPPDDAAMFMEEYGIKELSLNRMVAVSYDLLDQQSFFTVGEDEVRAWATRRQATALEAASEIHTDIAKGFVRAEVVCCQDLLELGGMAEAKAKGRLRLEGKEYIVKDGDIMHVRFNI